jgi:uncharacterized protein (UPF0335 family)
MSEVGHNSVAGDQLRLLIERVERLEEEKQGITDDIKDVYGEAKAVGFDPKIMKKLVALRKKDADTRKEEAALLDLYLPRRPPFWRGA